MMKYTTKREKIDRRSQQNVDREVVEKNPRKISKGVGMDKNYNETRILFNCSYFYQFMLRCYVSNNAKEGFCWR